MEALRNLIHLEARYLNNADLDNWMSLYSEDGVYWMPLDSSQTDPEEHDSIFYEDRVLMEIRKRNFGHKLSPSMQYPIRSSRVISDIHLESYDNEKEIYILKSSFHAVLLYKEQTVFAGSYQHHIEQKDADYFIKLKRVELLNADMPLPSIMIYI